VGLQQYKISLLIVTVVLALFVASPALQQITAVPQTDHITEFSVLGSYHNATYPYNVTDGQNYHLFFDVSNHLGYCAYYVIQVKFRNETQSAPDSFNYTNSDQPSLGDITFFVADKEAVEIPVDISLDYNHNPYNASYVDVNGIAVNGEELNANSVSIAWNPLKTGFYGNLFFELWIYNNTEQALQYHQRYVSLWLNMTT
jgi:uncharacterized membrane protein